MPIIKSATSATNDNDAIPQANMSVKEFMAWSRLGRTKVYELLNADELEAIKIGRRTFIPCASAQAWLDAQQPYRSRN